MLIIPAIDLYEGKVVRLKRGNYGDITIYSHDPATIAKRFTDQGISRIHVVDLEGAKAGKVKNFNAVDAIRKSTTAQIEFGGGLRTFDMMHQAIDHGVDYLVLGTKALDLNFLEEASETFQEKLIVGLDAKDGKIQTEGWLKEGSLSIEDALNVAEKKRVHTVIVTDIMKDGMLQGINTNFIYQVAKNRQVKIIASGGVSSANDVQALLACQLDNVIGLIVGKALYENKFDLVEANRFILMNTKGH